jgi:hypothetical protein
MPASASILLQYYWLLVMVTVAVIVTVSVARLGLLDVFRMLLLGMHSVGQSLFGVSLLW